MWKCFLLWPKYEMTGIALDFSYANLLFERISVLPSSQNFLVCVVNKSQLLLCEESQLMLECKPVQISRRQTNGFQIFIKVITRIHTCFNLVFKSLSILRNTQAVLFPTSQNKKHECEQLLLYKASKGLSDCSLCYKQCTIFHI